jgi:hypothetical protein
LTNNPLFVPNHPRSCSTNCGAVAAGGVFGGRGAGASRTGRAVGPATAFFVVPCDPTFLFLLVMRFCSFTTILMFPSNCFMLFLVIPKVCSIMFAVVCSSQPFGLFLFRTLVLFPMCYYFCSMQSLWLFQYGTFFVP